METNELQITRNLRACRQKNGMTQEMVAKKLRITRRSYINIENNPLRYSIKKLNNVAIAIGCNINDFLMHY